MIPRLSRTRENSTVSPLLLMKARFQYQQQEDAEQKLFDMLEQKNHHRGAAVPNQRSNSHSASSNVSLSSSLGSSVASSLGSTGSGAGKVRQMFEERRSLNSTLTGPNAFGRPPKNPIRNSPTKGYDKSYPLDPITGDKRINTFGWNRPPKSKTAAAGSISPNGDSPASSELRRSKSQHQIEGTIQSRLPSKVQSMNNLSDPHQNAMVNGRSKLPSNRFGYSTPSQSEHSKLDHALSGLELDETALAWLRQQADEKKEIEERARIREEQLLNTIRQQQTELERLRLAAAAAEVKANKASTAAPKPPVQTSRRANTRSFSSSTDDSEDFTPPKSETISKGRNPYKPKVPAAAAVVSKPKPALAPKPRPAPPRQVPAEAAQPAKKPAITSKPAVVNPSTSNKPTALPPGNKNASKSLAREPPTTSGDRERPRPPPADGLVACSICGRYFASDRVEKHETVCKKTTQKKRKVFDVTKMRVQGTEAESYVMTTTKKGAKSAARTPKVEQQQQGATSGKSDWRKKRESFLEAMRQAKTVQKHLAAGGDLRDLPPPPPSDTSDYLQCPHCSRRFAPGAAERHIPKCANIKSNKK